MTDNIWFWVLLALCGLQAYTYYQLSVFKLRSAIAVFNIIAFLTTEREVVHGKLSILEEENNKLKEEIKLWNLTKAE